MLTEALPLTFICSICGEPSHDICVVCTKDACGNHRCARCKCCSDCCSCDAPLSASETEEAPLHTEPPPVPSPALTMEAPPVSEPEPVATSESAHDIVADLSESLPELFRPE